MDELDADRVETDSWIERPSDPGVDPVEWISGLEAERELPDLRGTRKTSFRADPQHGHYIARFKENLNMPSFVGPFVRKTGLLLVPGTGTNPVAVSSGYEVLVVPDTIEAPLCWMPYHGGQLPAKALRTGIKRGQCFVYIGKRNDVGVGMICALSSSPISWEFYSSAGQTSYSEFDVLCRL